MNGSENKIPTIVKGIIKQRKLLIREKKSKKNEMLCFKHIKTLSNYIQAYESRWTIDNWQRFVINHTAEIIYLIPENKSGLTIKQKLYDCF